MYQRVVQYLDVKIWNLKLDQLSKYEAWGIHVLKVLVLTVRDFYRDKCAYRASALTFFTLLTIVPVLGMAFGIAQGFGLEEILEEQIKKVFEGQEEVMNRILNMVNNLLSNTKEELIAGIGVIVLLWSVLRILSNIENTMNAIWHIKKPRTIIRRIVDYSAFMVIVPILVATASGLTVYISSVVRQYTQESEIIGSFSPIINFPLKMLPYMIIWLVFSFLYLVMPNKRVSVKGAIIGGIIAGTAYQITQWGYIKFQVGASSYNAVYGSFAALPLFLVWLQLSWIIVLFGAELHYAIQNVHKFEQKKEVSNISNYYKRILMLTVIHVIIKRFEAEEPPIMRDEIQEKTGIPMLLLQDILEDLVNGKIISITPINKKTAYQPARNINKLTVHHIFNLLDKEGVNQLNLADYPAFENIEKALYDLKQSEETSGGNILLKDV